jgi:hypothetical protein
MRLALTDTEHKLAVAKRAAQKLATMYHRGECQRRAEIDELLNAFDAWLPVQKEAHQRAREMAEERERQTKRDLAACWPRQLGEFSLYSSGRLAKKR